MSKLAIAEPLPPFEHADLLDALRGFAEWLWRSLTYGGPANGSHRRGRCGLTAKKWRRFDALSRGSVLKR